MLVISDITEQHEIRRVLGEAKERAEAASRAKTDFVANISHEIRTPLNGILGIAQVMEREASEPAQLDRLRIIRDCGQGLMAVLNDVLDISRIEAGQMMLDYKDFDLVEAVEGSCAAFVSMAAEKGLAFTIDIDAEAHGCWWGDGDRLRQVLANLASNAVKFTESGSVGVSVSATESGVAFRITDTGVGIPADRLDDLFGKFQQLDASATRRHGGAGLGLALCRELVTLMGGVLTVTSRPGAGSKFSFEAPLGRDVRAPYETRQAGPDAEAEAAPGLQMEAAEQPIRILAAEDNLTNRLIVKALLEPMGVELTMVENGAQAIEAVAGIRGLEARRGGRRLPVVAVTANVMDFQRAQYLAAGIDAIVAKPIEAAALFAVIEQCLADPPTGAIASAA